MSYQEKPTRCLMLVHGFNVLLKGTNTFQFRIPPGFTTDRYDYPYMVFQGARDRRLAPDSWRIDNDMVTATWDVVTEQHIIGLIMMPVYGPGES